MSNYQKELERNLDLVLADDFEDNHAFGNKENIPINKNRNGDSNINDSVMVKNFKEFIKKNFAMNQQQLNQRRFNQHINLESILELSKPSQIDITQIGYYEALPQSSEPDAIVQTLKRIGELLCELIKECYDIEILIFNLSSTQLIDSVYFDQINLDNIGTWFLTILEMIKEQSMKSRNIVKITYEYCMINQIDFVPNYTDLSALMIHADTLIDLFRTNQIGYVLMMLGNTKTLLKLVITHLWSIKSLINFNGKGKF